MQKEKYHSILQRHAIPFGCHIIGQNFVLQHDNNLKHSSRLFTNYLKSKEHFANHDLAPVVYCFKNGSTVLAMFDWF